jgi:hypothetical protein
VAICATTEASASTWRVSIAPAPTDARWYPTKRVAVRERDPANPERLAQEVSQVIRVAQLQPAVEGNGERAKAAGEGSSSRIAKSHRWIRLLLPPASAIPQPSL